MAFGIPPKYELRIKHGLTKKSCEKKKSAPTEPPKQQLPLSPLTRAHRPPLYKGP